MWRRDTARFDIAAYAAAGDSVEEAVAELAVGAEMTVAVVAVAAAASTGPARVRQRDTAKWRSGTDVAPACR